MKKKITILFLAFLNLCFGQGTNLIEGRILDENLQAMPGVQIFIKDQLIGQTDLDGYYSVKINSDIKTLTYRFLGMAETPVKLTANCNSVEIIMRDDGLICINYSPSASRKYKRLEKKKFKNLVKEKFENLEKLHDMAYKQGLFKTQKVCGKIIFK
jgi:hypothetical protein